ncbi:MAG: peptide deformylase [Bacteroidota bacterium]|jgi:peptide deformylase
MSQLPIYLFGNEILKKKTKPVEEVTDTDIKLIQDMFETMHEANGIGLAANQVGANKQILVVDISEMEAGKGTKPIVVINPVVLDDEGEWEFEEGCLSIPDVRENVLRAEKITLRYNDINMKEKELEADGLLARVLLHEIDHLNGVLFTDHLSATKRTLLKSKLTKISKGDVDTTYEVVAAPLKKKLKKK